MAVQSIGLFDESGTVSDADLAALAAALQTQIDRDLGPAWGVQAKIEVGAASPGTWKLRIVDPSQLPDGAGGVHLDKDGVPFAIAEPGPQMSVAASHELCEMLVDPFGQAFITAPSIDPAARGRTVYYLVEVGDPCEVFNYKIDGVTVSDFVLRDYYFPQAADQVDQLGKLSQPFAVPRGCYISWYDPADKRWHQKRPDGSFVTAPQQSEFGAAPRRERDEVFGDPDRHDLARLLTAFAPETT